MRTIPGTPLNLQNKFKTMKFTILVLLLPFIITKSHGKMYIKATTVFNSEENDDDNIIERGEAESARINLSYPGTRWCGPGNTASDYNELGQHKETDKCCRDHDHCDNIASGETKYGLTNNDAFTRLHCRCDQEFNQCLIETHQQVSNKIGYTYFAVRNKCYKNEFPILECQKYETRFFLRRCVEYILDTSKPKSYQWFDLPFYGGDGQNDGLGRC